MAGDSRRYCVAHGYGDHTTEVCPQKFGAFGGLASKGVLDTAAEAELRKTRLALRQVEATLAGERAGHAHYRYVMRWLNWSLAAGMLTALAAAAWLGHP